jgi:glycosyltransferase involved in cell wall biosynthesis
MDKTATGHLPVLFGYHASNLGNSHVPLSLCRHWQESGRDVRLTVPSTDDHQHFPWVQPAMTHLKKRFVYRFGGKAYPRQSAESLFLKTTAGHRVVYLWAGLSLDIFKKFKARGVRIVVERINCHQATSRRILDQAHRRWGLDRPAAISNARIAEENEKLDLADAVFCPSPMVRDSMKENGVAEEKLLDTSYGWAPERFPAVDRPGPDNPRPVFLFVGTLCVRKGVPLLLEAWRRAGIDGDLILCGAVDPEITKHFGDVSQVKNVRHVPYTRDIGRLFRQADAFVFPTLEEGGPMVTYEAMAHGLAPLVTPMGAGAIAQNGLNARVLPDSDPDAWAGAMTAMAEDPARRRRIGEQARQRAGRFTWSEVAARRAGLLEDRFPRLWRR